MLCEVRTTLGRHRAATSRHSDGRLHPVQEGFRSENTLDGARCMDHPAAGPELPSGGSGVGDHSGKAALRGDICRSIDGILQ